MWLNKNNAHNLFIGCPLILHSLFECRCAKNSLIYIYSKNTFTTFIQNSTLQQQDTNRLCTGVSFTPKLQAHHVYAHNPCLSQRSFWLACSEYIFPFIIAAFGNQAVLARYIGRKLLPLASAALS